MLPTINGKKVSEWSFSDLQDILDNEDFRESDYLDYKKSFEYFDIPKNNTSQRNEAKQNCVRIYAHLQMRRVVI